MRFRSNVRIKMQLNCCWLFLFFYIISYDSAYKWKISPAYLGAGQNSSQTKMYIFLWKPHLLLESTLINRWCRVSAITGYLILCLMHSSGEVRKLADEKQKHFVYLTHFIFTFSKTCWSKRELQQSSDLLFCCNKVWHSNRGENKCNSPKTHVFPF